MKATSDRYCRMRPVVHIELAEEPDWPIVGEGVAIVLAVETVLQL